MSHQVVWEKMNAYDAEGNVTLKVRGEFVDASESDALDVLVQIGAVRPVNTELPTAPDSYLDALAQPAPEPTPEQKAALTGIAEPPGEGALKTELVDYAVASGQMSREEAEKMNKDDLRKALGV